jgi:hypothetical protein
LKTIKTCYLMFCYICWNIQPTPLLFCFSMACECFGEAGAKLAR